jgi:hypothetical protein
MRRFSLATALVAALMAGGCELDVQNPNDPDAERAFSDPAGLEQLLGGAFRTWVGTRGGFFSALPMTTMADSYTASWNNAAIRFYSSVGADGCPSRCGWTNSATAAEAAGGLAVNEQWYGYYTVLSSANDVLRAIEAGICFDDDCEADDTQTSRNGAIARMLQAMAFAGLAMVYDKAFIVDENTDLSSPAAIAAIEFSPREEMRDTALAVFDQAYAAADGGTWKTKPDLKTDADWAGVGSGREYTRQQVLQLIRTMQAELIAMFPRNATENTAADWARVATLASQGISSGTAFDWEFFIDVSSREGALDGVKTWGNSIGTMRVDTRVAAILTTNHQHPWPEAAGGNPCPTISADRRVGDGSWGPADDFNGYSTKAATANAGTDFACSGVAIFPAARGQYHQSNLQHVRYQHLAYRGENLPGFDATGQDPMYTRQMNDLLWAEGLIRSNGDKALAAQKINNSRVGRGGLPPVSGGQSNAELLAALQYEQEIEFMGQGATPFFNRRRIDGLVAGTPRHMPVPAKELDVLVREVYTFGGASAPDMSVIGSGPGGVGGGGRRIRPVGEIWKDLLALRRVQASRLF